MIKLNIVQAILQCIQFYLKLSSEEMWNIECINHVDKACRPPVKHCALWLWLIFNCLFVDVLLLCSSLASSIFPSSLGDAHVQRMSAWGLCSSYILCSSVGIPQPTYHPAGSVHRAAWQIWQRQDHKLSAPGPVFGIHSWEHGKNLLWWDCKQWKGEQSRNT